MSGDEERVSKRARKNYPGEVSFGALSKEENEHSVAQVSRCTDTGNCTWTEDGTKPQLLGGLGEEGGGGSSLQQMVEEEFGELSFLLGEPQCAPTIVNHKCPVCRQDFVDTFDVPDPLEDPMRWFHVVDVDQSGTIEKSELVDALKGMFPIDPDALERVINENWNTWDADGNGTLDASEFRNLLAPFLEETMGNLRNRIINKDPPDLAREPVEWFDYWDEDESGTLERPEVARALIKTIPRLNGQDEAWLTGMFATIWSLFDPNGDGQIDYEEFRMTDGLHETLVANFL